MVVGYNRLYLHLLRFVPFPRNNQQRSTSVSLYARVCLLVSVSVSTVRPGKKNTSSSSKFNSNSNSSCSCSWRCSSGWSQTCGPTRLKLQQEVAARCHSQSRFGSLSLPLASSFFVQFLLLLSKFSLAELVSWWVGELLLLLLLSGQLTWLFRLWLLCNRQQLTKR